MVKYQKRRIKQHHEDRSMLDYRTETFLVVCEYMNYTKAAEALNLTQPAISGQIKYLENYYGVKLFVYENKKLSLTKQGEKLKRALQTVMHDELRLKRELAKQTPAKVYRIGATLSLGDAYLPKVLPNYLEQHKELEIDVTVANTESLLKKLDQGMLDLVLTEGYFVKDEYENRLIREEELGVFCGSDYELGSVNGVEDLFGHRLICREKGSGTRAVFEHFLLEKGYGIEDFSNKCEFTSLNLIKEMLVNNQGISVLYKCVVEDLLGKGLLTQILVPGLELRHDFNAVWQKNSMYGYENEEFLARTLEK